MDAAQVAAYEAAHGAMVVFVDENMPPATPADAEPMAIAEITHARVDALTQQDWHTAAESDAMTSTGAPEGDPMSSTRATDGSSHLPVGDWRTGATDGPSTQDQDDEEPIGSVPKTHEIAGSLPVGDEVKHELILADKRLEKPIADLQRNATATSAAAPGQASSSTSASASSPSMPATSSAAAALGPNAEWVAIYTIAERAEYERAIFVPSPKAKSRRKPMLHSAPPIEDIDWLRTNMATKTKRLRTESPIGIGNPQLHCGLDAVLSDQHADVGKQLLRTTETPQEVAKALRNNEDTRFDRSLAPPRPARVIDTELLRLQHYNPELTQRIFAQEVGMKAELMALIAKTTTDLLEDVVNDFYARATWTKVSTNLGNIVGELQDDAYHYAAQQHEAKKATLIRHGPKGQRIRLSLRQHSAKGMALRDRFRAPTTKRPIGDPMTLLCSTPMTKRC